MKRSCGILLHPTSFPGPCGAGDLGRDAYDFVNFLSESKQSLWQILPLSPPGYGNSPYQSFSAFAGNTLLINPDRLAGDRLLSKSDTASAPKTSADRVDFGKAIEYKNQLLEKAYKAFKRGNNNHLSDDFENFSRYASAWLEDYALFRALQESRSSDVWNEWEPDLIRRDKGAIESARHELSDRIRAHKFFQYLFFKQWLELKSYANKHGIKIIGDMPIFVAHNSADVWTHPDMFRLDEKGNSTVVSGVPPDAFSETGQRWGNPLYDWDRMRQTGFRWWIDRMRFSLHLVDIVRVDHFRGFAACWEIPATDETAENGRWIEVPGRELFSALKQEFRELPILAEDLGTITPDVEELRDEFHFPGMRVLQFAFGGDSSNTHLPHHYIRDVAAYTGTHDNDTTVGWFQSKPGEGSTRDLEQIEHERAFCLKYLDSTGKEINWDFIRAIMASVADLAIIPLQDVLGLDSSARMNLPASQDDNWTWRYKPGALTRELSDRLGEMTELYERAPKQ